MPNFMRVTMNNINDILSKRGLETGGYAQKVFANSLIRHCDKRVPFATGTLKRLVRVEEDGKIIRYYAPYARYQYFGKVMVGSPPKRVVDRDLKYNHAPARGKLWAERTWSEDKEAILSEVAKAAGGKTK